MAQVNIYEAKTQLSSLIAQALNGEEVVIARAGKPQVRLVPVKDQAKGKLKPRKFGQNYLKVTYIAPDFYDDLPAEMFDTPLTPPKAK